MIAELIIVENEHDHRAAMDVVNQLSSSDRPKDIRRLRAQSMFAADWEAEAFAPDEHDPLEALNFWIEQSNLSPPEIAEIFGGRSYMWEVLAGKRSVSKSMMVRAHKQLGVPLEVLFELLEHEPTETSNSPADRVERSVTPDYIICLEDGKMLKLLTRHLMRVYEMTPDQYRAKWRLPANYPMVAPNYARVKSAFARRMSGQGVTSEANAS